MDLLNIATDWAKAEVFSTKFFILFGVLFLLATVGFWKLGKTDMAKAFIWPTLVAGLLLLVLGAGLLYGAQSSLKGLAAAYDNDPQAFVATEITRAEKIRGEYEIAVFKAIPIIIMVAALLIIFVPKPLWQAIGITIIALMVVVLLIDINAYARVEAYHKQLSSG